MNDKKLIENKFHITFLINKFSSFIKKNIIYSCNFCSGNLSKPVPNNQYISDQGIYNIFCKVFLKIMYFIYFFRLFTKRI